MDFRHLRHFLAIVRTGSLTRAAGTLNLTVAAVSKSLQRLEDELGVALLERGRRGMRPTVFGEALVQHATLAGNVLERARSAIEELRDPRSGSVSIGTAPGAAPAILPGAIVELRRERPNVHVTVQEGLLDLVNSVLIGDLDLALIASAGDPVHPDLASAVVLREQVAAIGGSMLARRSRSWSLEALRKLPWALPRRPNPLRMRLERAYAERSIEPPTAMIESGSVLFINALLQVSEVVSYLPLTLCRAEIERGKLLVLGCRALDWQREVSVVWSRERPLPPVAAALLEILKARSSESVAGANS